MTNMETDERVTLLVQHIFGRNPGDSTTVLTSRAVSRLHAVIFWDGETWVLHDTSRNGSYLNGKQLASGGKVGLKRLDRISFSTGGDAWVLNDVSPPTDMLLAITAGLPDIVLGSMVVLPSTMRPEITIYIDGNGSWVCESEAGTSILKNGDRVGMRGHLWRFIEAKCAEATVQYGVPAGPLDPVFTFNVSQDEEHISVTLSVNGESFCLGQRSHHYLLLLLVRKRNEDKAAGVKVSEQGWLSKDVLSKMTGLAEAHINIQVYRFRKQLAELPRRNAELLGLVEKRRGELRFNCDAVHISG